MRRNRRQSREAALQIEFARLIAGSGLQDMVNRLGATGEPELVPPDEFTMRILTALDGHADEVDAALGGVLQRWTTERLGAPDRALLRLGVAELIYLPEVPAGAVINEYIELARVYGDDRSPKFVNAILDAVRKQREQSDGKPGGEDAASA